MPIRALLFDFDGTLADSFGAITASVNHVRAQFGHTAMTEAAVKDYVGYGLTNLVEKLVPDADPAQAVALYREHHPQVMLSGTRLFPGVETTLETLQNWGFALGVCSNKSVAFTRRLVEGLGLAARFGCVLGPEDTGAAKPDPSMLLEGCRRLKVSTNETVYIGDMTVDVQTARAAGMPVWLVPFGVHSLNDAGQPDRRLADFEEILQLVR
jgi:phosphoglycolate phosphatase